MELDEKVEKLRERVLLLREDHNFIFRLGLSLVTAAIAALTIIYAGAAEEVRFGTILSRALLGFILSGAGVFLFTWWLDGYGIAIYVRRDKELEQIWLSARENGAEEQEAAAAGPEDSQSGEPETQAEAEEEQPAPATAEPEAQAG